ncbi:protein prenyltransferase alpha subunit repeat-containing protein 1 [Diachasma alloeum]|uniref:protein prenyltransferase alpha subunit repeat-containing protein 1 n=1 Tax=Diachasma alloeum TaxID=454923 RepID=UPI0007381D63|nr:protein prenyltransferase alpha subunit repeat-containing protein 1 [Diachasma alloeum]
MQEDVFPAAEKILSDIENVLRKDVNLESFEIIPSPDSENRSPVYHDENSLGLASWCVQPLYTYAYTRLIDLRLNELRREDPSTVSRWLMGALLLNPDVSTFWNMRRELVKSGRLDPLEELRFTRAVLYYKPKCFEAFSYRRWLVKFTLVEQQHPNVDVESLLRTEMTVSGTSADRYANNYHAWSHREQMILTYEALCPSSLGSLLISEWEAAGKWCSCHVSDHSGLSYRQFLLKRLLLLERQSAESRLAVVPEELARRRDIILDFVKAAKGSEEVFLMYDGGSAEVLEVLHSCRRGRRNGVDYDRVLMGLSYWIEDCKLNEELIEAFPGHEALWYHRRFLAFALRRICLGFLKDSCYGVDCFEPRDSIRLEGDGGGGRKCLLEVAFEKRNEGIVQRARKQCQGDVAEKFMKFLAGTGLRLEP